MALSPKDRRLIRLATAICLGDWERLRELRRAAPDGEPDRAWREVLLQAHLFAGFPRVVEASEVLTSVGGLGLPGADEAAPQGDCFDTGAELFERIYAENTDAVRDTLRAYHPTLERWILGHAYGRVLGRPGLAPDRRELAAVASLAVLDQDRQLASHVRGALHCGATPEELTQTMDAVADLVPEASLGRARRVIDRFVSAAGSDESH